MDAFCLVRPLHSAIYGRVALVRHRASGRYYALKMMSLAHMRARRAVTGPSVQENGFTELQILRRLGRNLIFSRSSGPHGSSKNNPNNQIDHQEVEEAAQDEVEADSWSVSPRWRDDGNADMDSTMSHDSQHLLMLHQDFVDERTNTRCLVFDYCPYGELYAHVTAQASSNAGGSPRGLPLETARSCFEQIARAVRFLHARDIAHRDLSLENVLLDTSRRCRLADFGLARTSGSRCSGARVGKSFYMAPEVVTRHCYGAEEKDNGGQDTRDEPRCYNGLQADVWSLGVLLFIMVTGIPPFESASESDARFRVVAKPEGGVDELLQAWGLKSYVPRKLQDLLAWMLRIDPIERPTAAQVCEHVWLQVTHDEQQQHRSKVSRENSRWCGQGEKRHSAEPEEENESELSALREPQEELEGEAEATRSSREWPSPHTKKRVKRAA
ncbi:hypothetical protein BBJ28_00017661 [Nothophytophthora sp. Chile5]|nr:hypothetical protein BBJ28_00017661 [Nothophytophthora sp. Chile5]